MIKRFSIYATKLVYGERKTKFIYYLVGGSSSVLFGRMSVLNGGWC